ncbi:MAG: amylo-alpha-1,6-glucosidase [Terriglobales bacterium]
MDETSSHQYYIAAKSSPADDRAGVLKYGEMFCVFDRFGDIQPSGLGEEGLFFQGTRYLSQLAVSLWNSRHLLLSSTIETNNFLFAADLANLDVSYHNEVVVRRGTLHLHRSKFLWKCAYYEEFKFTNYGLAPLSIPFRIMFDADFTDIFEVRGMHRQNKGRHLENCVTTGAVMLAYEGLDGIVRKTQVHCDPAPMGISGTEMHFRVVLGPAEAAVLHLTISCDPNAVPERVGYSSAMNHATEELRKLDGAVPEIQSSNSRFNDWVRRSFADIRMMTIGNPEVNYPYAGVPWFSTVFGRDGIITAMEMLWLNPQIAKGVLQYLAATQATEVNHAIEAEPGKILHEMRRGEMANLGEIPFGRYYGTVDATPLFIMLAGAYYEHTGDLEFLRNLWPHIESALQWIDEFGDVDGDGFVEYTRHSSNGLVQQGWKDSNDSVFHSDGTLAQAPIALCEVQGYVYAAKVAASRLNCAMGNKNGCAGLLAEAELLQKRFEDAFWCDELSTYALALDGKKKPCRVRASNAGHCLYTGIASRERGQQVAKLLLGGDFCTGWGIRTLACGEARYNPLSYHNGSVWPHDNAIIASGVARYGLKELAGKILMGLLDVSNQVDLHRLPELFCGINRRQGEGPTLYPVACSPQAWSAGAVFLVLQACLGISVDDKNRRIAFERPLLPDGIPQLWIKGLICADSGVNLFLERQDNAVQVEATENSGNIEISFTN